MELTSLLDTEKHSNENMRQQLRNISLELEESQSQVTKSGHLVVEGSKLALQSLVSLTIFSLTVWLRIAINIELILY